MVVVVGVAVVCGGSNVVNMRVNTGKRIRKLPRITKRQRNSPSITRRNLLDLVLSRSSRREECIVISRRICSRRESKGLEQAAVTDVRAGFEERGREDDAGGLVEEIADGDVAGCGEDAVVREGGGEDELGVAAGDEEGEEGKVW